MERSSTKTRPYVIVAPDGTKLTGKWFRSEETFKKDLQDGEVRFLKKNDGWSVQFKQRLAEGKKLRTILDEEDFTDKKFRSLSDELEEIVGCSLGHPPKSVLLMKTLIDSVCKNSSSDIILDFFSGSATTAHAVMQLNAEDGGRQKFIMVQWPEKCAEKSEAFKAGYKNICEIGKKRIRCAGEKIKSESPLTTGNLDTGFRVLKVDETNFKNISVSPAELTQEMLKDFADNIKPDRNGLDLVFECLINWGVELHLPYAQEEFDGATIHIYDEDSLMACFDKNISLEVVKHMAKKKPLRAVFCDGCFSRDDEKINASEIFKLYAPNSNFKVV